MYACSSPAVPMLLMWCSSPVLLHACNTYRVTSMQATECCISTPLPSPYAKRDLGQINSSDQCLGDQSHSSSHTTHQEMEWNQGSVSTEFGLLLIAIGSIHHSQINSDGTTTRQFKLKQSTMQQCSIWFNQLALS